MGEQNTFICQHTLTLHRSVRDIKMGWVHFTTDRSVSFISCLSKHKIPYSCMPVSPSVRLSDSRWQRLWHN